MATLVSVNVGMPTDVPWRGRTVHTGVWKRPVLGPRMVRRLNIEGDGQGDLGGHGGEQRPVLVYQLDSYRHWARELRYPTMRSASVIDTRSARRCSRSASPESPAFGWGSEW